AGLAASTVTPGRTAPDASLTIPARATCAHAVLGRIAERTVNIAILSIVRMRSTSIDCTIASRESRVNVKYSIYKTVACIAEQCARGGREAARQFCLLDLA